jgi:hypothetical protein
MICITSTDMITNYEYRHEYVKVCGAGNTEP